MSIKKIVGDNKLNLYLNLNIPNYARPQNIDIFEKLLSEWNCAQKNAFREVNEESINQGKGSFSFVFNYFVQCDAYINNYFTNNINGFHLFRIHIDEVLDSDILSELLKYRHWNILEKLNNLAHIQLFNVISEFVNVIEFYLERKSSVKNKSQITSSNIGKELFDIWIILVDIRNLYQHLKANPINISKKHKLKKMIDRFYDCNDSEFIKLKNLKFDFNNDLWLQISRIHYSIFRRISESIINIDND